MDCKKTGELLLKLRSELNMTQKQVADQMNISDKTISKWERGLGCPDVSLLPELSNIFHVNIEDILAGRVELNESIGGNMNKLKFFVCPQCGNIVTATGEATLSCCGKRLEPLQAEKATIEHLLQVEPVEDQLFVTTEHPMKKEHYISFVAYVTGDKLLMAKQYPEWNMQFRFHKAGHGKLYFYCTDHGLFYTLV